MNGKIISGVCRRATDETAPGCASAETYLIWPSADKTARKCNANAGGGSGRSATALRCGACRRRSRARPPSSAPPATRVSLDGGRYNRVEGVGSDKSVDDARHGRQPDLHVARPREEGLEDGRDHELGHGDVGVHEVLPKQHGPSGVASHPPLLPLAVERLLPRAPGPEHQRAKELHDLPVDGRVVRGQQQQHEGEIRTDLRPGEQPRREDLVGERRAEGAGKEPQPRKVAPEAEAVDVEDDVVDHHGCLRRLGFCFGASGRWTVKAQTAKMRAVSGRRRWVAVVRGCPVGAGSATREIGAGVAPFRPGFLGFVAVRCVEVASIREFPVEFARICVLFVRAEYLGVGHLFVDALARHTSFGLGRHSHRGQVHAVHHHVQQARCVLLDQVHAAVEQSGQELTAAAKVGLLHDPQQPARHVLNLVLGRPLVDRQRALAHFHLRPEGVHPLDAPERRGLVVAAHHLEALVRRVPVHVHGEAGPEVDEAERGDVERDFVGHPHGHGVHEVPAQPHLGALVEGAQQIGNAAQQLDARLWRTVALRNLQRDAPHQVEHVAGGVFGAQRQGPQRTRAVLPVDAVVLTEVHQADALRCLEQDYVLRQDAARQHDALGNAPVDAGGKGHALGLVELTEPLRLADDGEVLDDDALVELGRQPMRDAAEQKGAHLRLHPVEALVEHLDLVLHELQQHVDADDVQGLVDEGGDERPVVDELSFSQHVEAQRGALEQLAHEFRIHVAHGLHDAHHAGGKVRLRHRVLDREEDAQQAGVKVEAQLAAADLGVVHQLLNKHADGGRLGRVVLREQNGEGEVLRRDHHQKLHDAAEHPRQRGVKLRQRVKLHQRLAGGLAELLLHAHDGLAQPLKERKDPADGAEGVEAVADQDGVIPRQLSAHGIQVEFVAAAVLLAGHVLVRAAEGAHQPGVHFQPAQHCAHRQQLAHLRLVVHPSKQAPEDAGREHDARPHQVCARKYGDANAFVEELFGEGAEQLALQRLVFVEAQHRGGQQKAVLALADVEEVDDQPAECVQQLPADGVAGALEEEAERAQLLKRVEAQLLHVGVAVRMEAAQRVVRMVLQRQRAKEQGRAVAVVRRVGRGGAQPLRRFRPRLSPIVE
ncbi:DUF885 domain-containing protein [Babesia caballi]|uniref:DUF885 domain-containing protein n=1 Tax=Babesia caballi TaxID=5871 RepID=A0AAV4LRG2_BABCB|nr:DUF885 domain-containing protein [Babesia caballi]